MEPFLELPDWTIEEKIVRLKKSFDSFSLVVESLEAEDVPSEDYEILLKALDSIYEVIERWDGILEREKEER